MGNMRLVRKAYLVRTSLQVLHNPTQACVVLLSPTMLIAHNDHTTVYTSHKRNSHISKHLLEYQRLRRNI